MAAPLISWRDSSDVELTNLPTFSGVIGGTPSAAEVLHLWNNYNASGSDPLQDSAIYNLSRDAGGSTFFSSGHEFVDRRYFEIRITGGLGGLSVISTSWVKLGDGATLNLPTIGNDQGVILELRVSAPADADTGDYVPDLQVREGSQPTGAGLSESTPDGVIVGAQFTDAHYIVWMGQPIDGQQESVVQNPAGVDDQVQVPDVSWIGQGGLHSVLEHLEQFDINDGSAQTLVAGEAYYGRIYADEFGTIEIVKGDKNTVPLTDADEPTLPIGASDVARVLREFDGLINDADIDQRAVPELFYLSWSGLNLTIGPGGARISNHLVFRSTSDVVTLPASTITTVWLNTDGSFSLTDPVTDRGINLSLELYTIATDGSTVTAVRARPMIEDLDRFVVDMHFQEPIKNLPSIYGQYPFDTPAYIERVTFWLDEDWDTGTSGDVIKLDIFARDEVNQTYATIYPSSGTVDRRPQIAFDQTFPVDTKSIPENRRVSRRTQFRADVVAVPAGSAKSITGGVTLVMRLTG